MYDENICLAWPPLTKQKFGRHPPVWHTEDCAGMHKVVVAGVATTVAAVGVAWYLRRLPPSPSAAEHLRRLPPSPSAAEHGHGHASEHDHAHTPGKCCSHDHCEKQADTEHAHGHGHGRQESKRKAAPTTEVETPAAESMTTALPGGLAPPEADSPVGTESSHGARAWERRRGFEEAALRERIRSRSKTQMFHINPHTVIDDRICIAMVGLPARGKSYISKAIVRYLTFFGCPIQLFNAGNKRRLDGHAGADASFFDPANAQASPAPLLARAQEQKGKPLTPTRRPTRTRTRTLSRPRSRRSRWRWRP